MDAEAAVRAWIDGWERGWAAGDTDAIGPIGPLYSPDAVFRSHPFREPEKSARHYALRAFADEELVECRFGAPVVQGDRAVVEYWAVLAAGRDEETLAGIAVIRFGPDGLVVEQRDYWAMEPGRRPPIF